MFRELVIFAYFAMIRIITKKSSLDTKTTKDNAETIRRSLKLPAAKFLKQQIAKITSSRKIPGIQYLKSKRQP